MARQQTPTALRQHPRQHLQLLQLNRRPSRASSQAGEPMRRDVSAALPRLQGVAAGSALFRQLPLCDGWQAACAKAARAMCNGTTTSSGAAQSSNSSGAADATTGTPVSAWDQLRLKPRLPAPCSSPALPWWQALPPPGCRGYSRHQQHASPTAGFCSTPGACYDEHSAAPARRFSSGPAAHASAGASQQLLKGGETLCVGGRPVAGKRTVAVGVSGGGGLGRRRLAPEAARVRQAIV